jgi:hypothetical protein
MTESKGLNSDTEVGQMVSNRVNAALPNNKGKLGSLLKTSGLGIFEVLPEAWLG